ncbi:SusC/RagA family TonB-linked outer membrane protein [Saccharicrinis sp. GN24d3]|uniref:SusC/RagA family TonB-linked outer membrane protein n=1 Tax=Saccharicrinis sp. GN24d3 TaxID=3458416 RepID=UPI004036012F
MKKILMLFVLLCSLGIHSLYAQEMEVTGIVTDAEGIPLPGVAIILKGTTQGTITNIDGEYTIEVPSRSSVLVFSFIGMQTQEFAVGGRTIINVVLKSELIGLEELVVVGFSVQKKANVTGATSTVKMEDVLSNRPITNALGALQGTVPGLQITSNSGQPGDPGLSLNIRGLTSINGGDPLVLVNNVPAAIRDVNPQDIESVTVLKDAAAASIYGARAAFGVVLITTKKGKRNSKPTFNYSSTYSFSSPTELPSKASTYDYVSALKDWGYDQYWTGQEVDSWLTYLDDYRKNPGTYPNGIATKDGLNYRLKDSDVIGAFLDDNGFTQIHNFNVSGGSENSAYRVSMGYSDEDGIVVTDNDSYTRYNFNTNYQVDITSKLKSTSDIMYLNSKQSYPIGRYDIALRRGAFTPAEGFHTFEDGTTYPYDTPANMERYKTPTSAKSKNLRLFERLDYELIKDLIFTGEFTYETKDFMQYSVDEQIQTVNADELTLNAADPEKTFYQKYNSQSEYKAYNVYANYTKELGHHHIGGLIGFNKEDYNTESFWAKKNNLINVDLPSISMASGDVTADDSFGSWAVMGTFARLNYNYKEKYFLEANGRYDGSSRFAEGDRYGFFPSISAGWTISKESFMADVAAISLLKLRASWGSIGNQQTSGLYPAIPGMSIGQALWINTNKGVRYNTINTPGLVSAGFTWEEVVTKNIGFDLNILNHRLTSSFDIYSRETIGMLAPGAELPAVLGASAPQQNAADLKSYGWELQMGWKDKIKDFSYHVAFTLSDGQSKITKFDNEAGLLSQYYNGYKFGQIWGYETDGYYTTDDFVDGTLGANLMNGTLKDGIPYYKGTNPNPGDIKYKDLDGDGIIFSGDNTLEPSIDPETGEVIPNTGPGDRKIIGNSTRRYQFGINGGAEYKGFDFSFVISGVGKRDVWRDNSLRFPSYNQFIPLYAHQLDYWTPENTDAYFPRNYYDGKVNYPYSKLVQTKYLINGAYLAVKNLTLGYTLPKNIMGRLGIDKLRVYVASENPFMLDNFPDGNNPELENKGEGGTYPYMKSFIAGLNLTF